MKHHVSHSHHTGHQVKGLRAEKHSVASFHPQKVHHARYNMRYSGGVYGRKKGK